MLREEKLLSIADKVGLDGARLKKDAASPTLDAALQSNFEAAQRLRLDGTPSFIVTTLDGGFMRIIPGFDEGAVRQAVADAKRAKPAG